MSTALRAANILPLAAFKARASEVLNGMKIDHSLVVITQNGIAAAVLLPPEEYDRLIERSAFLLAVGEGMADSAAGRTISHEELVAEFAPRPGV